MKRTYLAAFVIVACGAALGLLPGPADRSGAAPPQAPAASYHRAPAARAALPALAGNRPDCYFLRLAYAQALAKRPAEAARLREHGAESGCWTGD